MPKLSDAERRRIAREKAKQLAETPQPRISSQKAAQSQAQSQSQTQRQPQKQLSQSQKQLSQSSGASAGGSNRGPLWARFPRLLCLSFPCLFLLAFAGYVIWTSFKASPARSRPEAGPATSAASSVAAGATASVDKGPTGPKILPSSLTPRQLFGLWTHTYSVEPGSRRKLQLVSRNGSSLDMNAFRTESTVPGLVYATPSLPSGSSSSSPGSTEEGNSAVPEEAQAVSDCSEVPAAPHLQCCEDLAALRKQQDSRGPDGELPPWTEKRPGKDGEGEAYPRPPWVRGAPEDSIPLTHEAQADIWRHQHPEHRCAGDKTRFLVSYWDNPHFHGMGSHLHLMTAVLGLAVTYGRVFGLLNYSFHRAQHEGCRGPHFGSFECYFHNPTSPECDRKINGIWKSSDKAWRSSIFFDANRVTAQMRVKPDMLDLLASDEPYIVVSPRLLHHPWNSTLVPTNWGTPWMQMVPYISFGENRSVNARVARRMEVSWWRSQAVRYLLRFPSVYLCHLLNFARHQTFGLEAAQIALDGDAGTSGSISGGGGGVPSDAGNPTLGAACGAPPSACQAARELVSQAFNDQEAFWSGQDHNFNAVLNPEPWAPHPFVRVHVRGTDKRVEMRVLGFHQYQEALDRMREKDLPGVRSIWISSEQQKTIEEARSLSSWTVYTLEMEKKWAEGQNMPEHQWLFAKQFGLRDYVEASLCNLFIAELSDGYLFTLQSNWDRLANELRLTSGRLHAPFIPLNQGEW